MEIVGRIPDNTPMDEGLAKAMSDAFGGARVYGWAGLTFGQYALQHPFFILKSIPQHLSPALFDEITRKNPVGSLAYAIWFLSDDQFDRAIQAAPASGIKYGSTRMSKEQFASASKAAPSAARFYEPERWRKLQG